MITKQPFGRTGHQSSRAIFGSAALGRVTQEEADRVLDLLLEYGINHIDTAPSYGDAELRIGPWMRQHRKHFFLATKTDRRTYQEAREQFERSLERLQVDRVDLLQLHNLTDTVDQEFAFAPGGVIELLKEVKEKGLARFVGVTGHNITAARMHLESMRRYEFDSVLLPCNYLLLQDQGYAERFNRLVSLCRERGIAVQTIKSIARGLWGNRKRSYNTWYRPLSEEGAITRAIQWVLGRPDLFLITAADTQLLPLVLKAVSEFQQAPAEEEMKRLAAEQEMAPLFR